MSWIARKEEITLLSPDTLLDFGKYAGWRVEEVIITNPKYMDWIRTHVYGYNLSLEVETLLKKEFKRRKYAADECDATDIDIY